MTLSASAMLNEVVVGNDAAWILSFYTPLEGGEFGDPFIVRRSDYYATVRASLQSGLKGGTYSFVIEGMTDEGYKSIPKPGHPRNPPVVKLYLFWRDTNASVGGYVANVAGLTDTLAATKGEPDDTALVAVLAITRVSRKVGSLRYETHIEARELVYHLLDARPLCKEHDPKGLAGQDPLEVIKGLCGIERIPAAEPYAVPAKDGAAPVPEKENKHNNQFEVGQSLAGTFGRMGTQLEEHSGLYGRGMFLIRDGKLHFGKRPIPFAAHDDPARTPTFLSPRSGLVQIEPMGTQAIDGNFQPCESTGSPEIRRRFRVTLKGRPDLKPGDVVQFNPPIEDTFDTLPSATGLIGEVVTGGLLASLDDEPNDDTVSLYVTGVDHRLGRKSGFVTVVTGVSVNLSDERAAWDYRTEGHVTDDTDEHEEVEAAGEGRVAAASAKARKRAAAGSRFSEVGEVRSAVTKTDDAGVSQTVVIWRGLMPGDGAHNGARRLDIDRSAPFPASGVPYLTPWAWGKCGLVLPRYPGTRVLAVHRNGHRRDPLDVGALWQSEHGPDSEPGDWWLILPVGVPEPKRASLARDEVPEEHTGPATNDLIDAEGNRVIEVGELTVRVSRDDLRNAGERPTRTGEADSVTIEHVDGESLIQMKADGTVIIKGKNIELDAGLGTITLKAGSVDVE